MVSQKEYDKLLAEKNMLEEQVLELKYKLSRKGNRTSDQLSHGVVFRPKPSQDLSGIAALLHAGWTMSAIAEEYRVDHMSINRLVKKYDLYNWAKWSNNEDDD